MPDRAYRVYVVALRPRTPAERRDHPRGSVYVGSTHLPVTERLRHHAGPRGSRHVRRRGIGLRPALAPRGTFASHRAAKRAEHATAAKLRRQGYAVYGACVAGPGCDPDL